MPESVNRNSSDVVKLTIMINGSQMNENYQIVSIMVTKRINKIPSAVITFRDGAMPDGTFASSESNDFKPGNAVEIKAGYGSEESTLFKGIVVRHGIEISGSNDARLTVECKDEAIKMTIGRHNANFLKKKDSDIISAIVGKYSGLSAEITATEQQHDELVQYYCTDWDFILARAEANGYCIITEDAALTIKPPQASEAAQLTVTYGTELIEFRADIDSQTQLSSVKGIAWDCKTQKIIEQSGTAPSLNTMGDLTSDTLAGVLGCSNFTLQSNGTIAQNAVKKWADAQMLKSALSKIRGRMKTQGNAAIKPGAVVELSGVGKRFNGNVYISGVVHHIHHGNWFSEAQFGLSQQWHTERSDVSAPLASGFLPGISGLYIGIVMKLQEDPEGENRIQVKIPILKAETEGIWARVAQWYASNTVGAFFIPEIGDEVIVGYFSNDPSHPVILGSLYSSKNKPPYSLTDDNFTKALVTKSKIKIEFDDENKVITIETPGKNSVTISDKDKSILLKDQNSNKITLGEKGITMESPKDISLTAKGKISLTATNAISASSKADISIDGNNVNAAAKIGFKAKGNANAEVSASGQTTIKGAMVMIN